MNRPSFDCKGIRPGQTGHVLARSVNDNHCTGADFGGIGLDLDGVPAINGGDSCGYSYSIRAVPSCESP
jgi:hypothetical protein